MEELKFLYDGLFEDGDYTKSFEEFKSQYSTEENINKLYKGLVEDGKYTKSYDDFKAKYFTLKKKDSPELKDTSLQNPSELVGEVKDTQPSLDGDLTQTDVLSDTGDGTITLDDTDLDTDLAQLYDDFKKSGIVDDDTISSIKDNINLQKSGDFGFLRNMKTSYMFSNPAMSSFLGLKWNTPDKLEDVKKATSRNQQIDFLNELPNDKREQLLKYAVDRDDKLNADSTNALAFNEILMGKYNNLMKELAHSEKTYKTAKSRGMLNVLQPEFFQSIKDNMTELNSVIGHIDTNNKLIESNSEDISNFPDELDLLKRNYSGMHNFKEKTRLATARLIFGGKQKLENYKYGILDPKQSDFGLAFSELFGDGADKEAINLKEQKAITDEDNKQAIKQIEKEYSFLRPNMSVTDINSVGDFGQWASEQVAQQIPVIASMALTGGTVGSALVGIASAGDKELEMKISNDEGLTNYTDNEILLTSTGYGLGEFVFEKLGTGAILDNGRRAYKSIVKDGLKSEFKQGVKSFIKSNAKASLTESTTEGLTEFFQNILDRHYLGNKDVGLFDNVGEAMASGGFMGGVMNVSPTIAGMMTRPFSNKKTRDYVSENLKKIDGYNNQIKNPDITPAAKSVINEQISKLTKENEAIINSEVAKIESMKKSDVKKLIKIDSDIEKLKNDSSKIINDESLDSETKSDLVNLLKEKAISLNENKSKILDSYKDKKEESKVEKTKDIKKPTSKTIVQNESKTPDFVPDVDPKIKKERQKAKERLQKLREVKNKKAKDIQNIKKEAVKYVKSILGTNDLNAIKKSEFNSIVQKIRDAKNQKDIDKLVDSLNEQVNKTNKRTSDKRISKLLKTKLKDKKGKALVSQEAIDVITAIKNSDLTNKSLEELNEIESNNEGNDAIIEAVDIARNIIYSNSETSSESNKANFSQTALDKLSSIINEGRLEIKNLKESDKERKKSNIKQAVVDSSRKSEAQLKIQDDIKEAIKEDNLVIFKEMSNQIMNRISELFGEDINTESIQNADNISDAKSAFRDTIKDYYKKSNFDKQIKSKNIFLDKVHQSYRHVSSDLDTLIDIVSKKSSDEFLGGYLHSKISDGVRKAEEDYMKLTRKNKNKIQNKVTEIYSDSYPAIITKLGDLVESVVSDTNREVNTAIYDSNGNEIKMSRGNAMWLYNQYKNPKLKDNFENAGLTEEVMSEITNEFLTKEDIEFADWLSEEFYEDMYSQVNDTFKKIYFRNLPKIDNYSGQIRYQGVDGVKSTDMLQDSGYSREGTSLFFGSGIDRVNNKRPIDVNQDVFSNLFHYVDSANRFTSSAEIYRDIKEILNDDAVTENLKNYNRGDIKSQINKLVDYSFGFKDKKDDNPIVNFLIGAKILSSLALTPKILVTQAISTTLWLTENAPSVVKNALSFMANPVEGVKLMQEIYENSEYIRDRYSNSDFKKIEAAYVAQNMKYGHSHRAVRLASRGKDFLFGKLALANVMLGDAIGMFTLGVPYYKTVKDEGMKKFNGDEDKAIDYAIEKFNKRASKNQQSYQSNDRDIMQHSNLGKLVNMYGNSPKQYHRSTFQAVLQLKRALQGRETKGTVAGNMWKVVLNHMLQGALYQWVGTALVGLLSDDDEENTKLKDVAWGAAFGSLSKFFILGDLAQALWDTSQGKTYGQNPTLSPVISDYAKLFKEIDNYNKAAEAEDDVKMDESSMKLYRILLDLAGVPATKSENLMKNFKSVLDGDYDSDEEMILRLLNYSEYQIDNMNEEMKKKADDRKSKKAAATRKRRSKKDNKKRKRQFDKLR